MGRSVARTARRQGRAENAETICSRVKSPMGLFGELEAGAGPPQGKSAHADFRDEFLDRIWKGRRAREWPCSPSMTRSLDDSRRGADTSSLVSPRSRRIALASHLAAMRLAALRLAAVVSRCWRPRASPVISADLACRNNSSCSPLSSHRRLAAVVSRCHSSSLLSRRLHRRRAGAAH